MGVIFEPLAHTYTLEETGALLTPVSTVIARYYQEFAPSVGDVLKWYNDGRNNRNFGSAVEMLVAWDIQREEAAANGTETHDALQHWIESRRLKTMKFLHWIVEFEKLSIKGHLVCESQVWSEKYKVCGTVDLKAYRSPGSSRLKLYDFKTNKDLKQNDQYRRMLGCCKGLWDTTFNHYVLQLSIYAALCEMKGEEVTALILIWLNPKTLKMEEFEVPYLKDLAMIMIKENLKFK